MNQPPIFIINLKQDTLKHTHMTELCERYNLKYEFIDGVYGKQLSEEEINNYVDNEKALKYTGSKLTKSEIGCALSHLKTYNKIIDEKIPYALVLEDDIDFDLKLIDFLSLIDRLPDDWEIFFLGHHTASSNNISVRKSIWYKLKLDENFIVKRPCERVIGAYSFLLNLKGASKLKHMITKEKIYQPADYYTGSIIDLNTYVLDKPIIKANDYFFKYLSNMKDRNKVYDINRKQSNTYKLKKIFLKLGILRKSLKIKHKLLDPILKRYRLFKLNMSYFIEVIKPLKRYK